MSEAVFPECTGTNCCVRRNAPGGNVCITAEDEQMLIVLTGEPPVEALVECLQAGLDAGWLHLSMKTLVDLTRYYGVIDWGTLKGVQRLAAWASDADGRSSVAYLIRNSEFAPLIKAVSALFAHTSHRAFTDRGEAISWLTA